MSRLSKNAENRGFDCGYVMNHSFILKKFANFCKFIHFAIDFNTLTCYN